MKKLAFVITVLMGCIGRGDTPQVGAFVEYSIVAKGMEVLHRLEIVSINNETSMIQAKVTSLDSNGKILVESETSFPIELYDFHIGVDISKSCPTFETIELNGRSYSACKLKTDKGWIWYHPEVPFGYLRLEVIELDEVRRLVKFGLKSKL